MANSHATYVNQCVIELIPKKQDDENKSIFLESSSFIFMSSECRIRVTDGWENKEQKICRVYVKSKPLLTQQFYVTLAIFKGKHSISFPKRLVLEPSKYIWSGSFVEIEKQLPGAEKGNVNFRLTLQTESESHYDEKNSGDKLVQTSSYVTQNDSLDQLSRDFERLLDEDTEPNVVLKCGEVVIKVQKVVLKARSGFFKKKLQSLKGDVIDLSYVDPATFYEIIRYIYRGKSPDLSWETAKNIYKAGEICNTGCLKKRCVEFLIANLTMDNACECLAFADEYLKEKVIEYIMDKDIPFLDQYWKPFCEKDPKSANDVYYILVRKLRECRK